jgi:p-hydroxybenzoate 3-monooxygenase
MNLALNDVRLLAAALSEFYRNGRENALQQYPQKCLTRIWRAQRFSWWMTAMLHRFNDDDQYRQRLQLAELEHLVNSRAAATALAEDYVG